LPIVFSGHGLSTGLAFFWDEELVIEEYKLKKKGYFCGNRFLTLEKDTGFTHIICLIDTRECTIARVSKYSTEIIFKDTSFIPGKHRKGGQSAQRFARNREELIKSWMKDIASVIKGLESLPIILGGPGRTKNKVLDYLGMKDKKKIVAIIGCEYTCYGGILQVQREHLK